MSMTNGHARTEHPSKVPALLMMAHYPGTLAGVRCLGRHGVPIVIASDQWLAPARWSRWVSSRVSAPSVDTDPTQLVEWLLKFGKQRPGAVLYPTCDNLAWLIARYASELERYYRLYSPSAETIRTLLDKNALQAACAAVGIETPATWSPESEGDLASVPCAGQSYVVKPRTQVYLLGLRKGGVARNLNELRACWLDYREGTYAAELKADWPKIEYPLVQSFLPNHAGVHSVTGFVDRSGRLLATRACVKVLQEPANVGIGICFESAEPMPGFAERVAELCRQVGYFGMFEAEYILVDGRPLLIDFNPRYFGQMGFDIARGMPLAWMAHASAVGREDLAAEAANASSPSPLPSAYSDRLWLRWELNVRRAVRTMTPADVARWQAWVDKHSGAMVDASLADDDVRPGMARAAWMLYRALRHPRAYVRSLR